MDAILKMLSLVKNKNRRNKVQVFTMIKQLNICEYSAHFNFSLNCYGLVIFNSLMPSSLTSYIQNIVGVFQDAADMKS